ncbi:MAG: response regulator [Myxococcales bacterium]|nr:response regulator [Myxococcales bacterium]
MTPRPLRIQVIDDDPIALRVVAAVLRGLGHEVKLRDQALGSLSEVLRDRPDVVVLDLSMPGLGGAGFAELVSARNESAGGRIAIVLCSGAPLDELAAAAKRVGAIGAISKSADANALRSAFALSLARVTPAA